MSNISLQGALRTDKVTPDMQNTAAALRTLGYATLCNIPDNLHDAYGRPTSLYGGLTLLGTGTNAGCYTPEYRIQVENILRPQYSEYLNVPEGLAEIIPNVGPNRQHYDTMGVNRARVFGLDGSYDYIKPPALNPKSDKDFLLSQAYEQMQTVRANENRSFTRSASVMNTGAY